MIFELREFVIEEFGNPVIIGFDQSNGEPLDLSQVTKTIVTSTDEIIRLDSESDPAAVTWDGSVLTLKLHGLGIPPGAYIMRVAIVIPGYPEGLAILHENSRPRVRVQLNP